MTTGGSRGSAPDDRPGDASDYLPISSYGLVGNRETCALVGRDGSVDWLPLPHLDSGSVFAAVLDADRGGRFRIGPAAPDADGVGEQRYLDETAVLETAFDDGDGSLTVTDFLPPVADDDRRPTLYRRVTRQGAPAGVELDFSPRFDYARADTELSRADDVPPSADVVVASGADEAVVLSAQASLEVEGDSARAAFEVDGGESRWFVLRFGEDRSGAVDAEACERRLAETADRWRTWAHDCPGEACPYRGPHHDLAVRSGIVLRLFAARETGAIAAAATTSLPEDVGGVRNWDYRYNWIRDSAATAQVLYLLGHERVATDYHDWFMDLCSIDDPADIQPVQGLHGDTDLAETELDHLSGYRGSAPVRVGNDAAGQRQLDTYGELLLAIDQSAALGDGLSDDRWADVASIVDYVCDHWDEPGSGIWEFRTGPRQFTHSKLMCWAALDRGVAMARRGDRDAPFERWRDHRDDVRRAVEERGFSEARESFVQTLDGDDALDATALLVPVVGFLPFDDDRVLATVDAVAEELATDDGLVYRYEGDDGLPGSEGAFVRASFWLVNALALSGRVEAAERVFEGVVGHANDLGLLSEELDPDTGAYLGNYPQAYSHVGLANSVLYLNYARGRDVSPEPMGVRLGSGGLLDDA